MKQLLLLLFMFISGIGFTQFAFHRIYGGDQFDYGYDIVELPDSGFFVTGMSGSMTPGHAQAFLLRLDKNGAKEWIIPYGGPENDAGLDLEFKENVGVFLTGRTTSSNGDFDAWITLLDDQGNVQWERTYPGPNWEEAVESAITQNDGLVVAVHSFGNGTQDQDASLLHLNAQGDTVWVQNYSAPGNDEITKIARFQDSLFVISSNHYNEAESHDFALLQVIHENGTLVWDDTIGIYPGNSYLNDFYLSGDSLYGVGTHKLDDVSTFNRMRHMHRLSLQGNGDLLTDVSVSAGNMIEDVVTPAFGLGFIYSAFRFQDPMVGPNNEFYIGLNTLTLTPIAASTNTVTEGDDRLYEGIPTLDSGAVFVGYQSLPTGGTGLVVLKIAKNFGYPTIPEIPFVNSILSQDEIEPLTSLSVYPNPAENVLNIHVQDGSVDFYRLVNLEGKELISGVLTSDFEQVNTSFLQSGVYLLHLHSNATLVGVKRLVIR